MVMLDATRNLFTRKIQMSKINKDCPEKGRLNFIPSYKRWAWDAHGRLSAAILLYKNTK